MIYTVHFDWFEVVALALLTGLVWHAIGTVAKTAALQFNAAVARKQDVMAAATKTALAKKALDYWKEAEEIQQRMAAAAPAKTEPLWTPKKDSIVFIDPSKTGVNH